MPLGWRGCHWAAWMQPLVRALEAAWGRRAPLSGARTAHVLPASSQRRAGAPVEAPTLEGGVCAHPLGSRGFCSKDQARVHIWTGVVQGPLRDS